MTQYLARWSGALDRLLRVAQYLNLETAGRKTGRPHTVELSFAYDGEALYCLAGRGGAVDWAKNIRHTPRVTVKAGGRAFPARAEILEGREVVDRILRLFQDKYGSHYVKQWYEGTSRVPVRIVLTPRGGGRVSR